MAVDVCAFVYTLPLLMPCVGVVPVVPGDLVIVDIQLVELESRTLHCPDFSCGVGRSVLIAEFRAVSPFALLWRCES